ncbi:unnamed protein product [Bathycoccus prasinos]
MKFLEDRELAQLNNFLSHVNLGDHEVTGQLENYSCKLAGQDKKNFGAIETDVVEELSSSPNLYSTSPVGPLTDSHSRKTLIYLILTLNQAYPDHDFSNLRPNNFSKEVGVPECKEEIDQMLYDVGKVGGSLPFSDELWRCINSAIELQDVDVYSYAAINDGDPFDGDGSLWNFNYFFYNKKLKRILFFSCAASKIKRDQSFYEDEEENEHVGVRMRSSQMTPTPPLNYSSRGYAASFDDLAMDDMQ